MNIFSVIGLAVVCWAAWTYRDRIKAAYEAVKAYFNGGGSR